MELEETYDPWERRVRDEGRNDGDTRGRAQVVLRQLARRFGTLDADVVARVRSASSADLDRFADRVLDAVSIGEVVA